MNTVRLATLNLHHLKEWEARKKEVVQLVREVQPDILLVQEARTADEINQIEFLAAECNFPHSGFHAFCMKRAPDQPKGSPETQPHGLGFLSRVAVSFEAIEHASSKAERRGFLMLTVDGASARIANVHFDNDDAGALVHLKEVAGTLGPELATTIIAGDFNMFDAHAIASVLGATHTLSTEIAPYESYPGEGTLDYIAAPRQTISFKATHCPSNVVSDHRMVVADLSGFFGV